MRLTKSLKAKTLVKACFEQLKNQTSKRAKEIRYRNRFEGRMKSVCQYNWAVNQRTMMNPEFVFG